MASLSSYELDYRCRWLFKCCHIPEQHRSTEDMLGQGEPEQYSEALPKNFIKRKQFISTNHSHECLQRAFHGEARIQYLNAHIQ